VRATSVRSLAAEPVGRRAVLVLTTWPADQDPRALADPLVTERLAACVNILPAMDSVYRWQGRVQHDREHQVFIKTTVAMLRRVHDRVRDLHPYDVPEFVVVNPVAGAASYLDWIAASTSRDDGD
jgi:periplasmic divalent cation tolerance protein